MLDLELLPFYLARFLKSVRNHTSHQVGGLFGGTSVIGLIFGSSGVCTRCMRLYGSVW